MDRIIKAVMEIPPETVLWQRHLYALVSYNSPGNVDHFC